MLDFVPEPSGLIFVDFDCPDDFLLVQANFPSEFNNMLIYFNRLITFESDLDNLVDNLTHVITLSLTLNFLFFQFVLIRVQFFIFRKTFATGRSCHVVSELGRPSSYRLRYKENVVIRSFYKKIVIKITVFFVFYDNVSLNSIFNKIQKKKINNN